MQTGSILPFKSPVVKAYANQTSQSNRLSKIKTHTPISCAVGCEEPLKKPNMAKAWNGENFFAYKPFTCDHLMHGSCVTDLLKAIKTTPSDQYAPSFHCPTCRAAPYDKNPRIDIDLKPQEVSLVAEDNFDREIAVRNRKNSLETQFKTEFELTITPEDQDTLNKVRQIDDYLMKSKSRGLINYKHFNFKIPNHWRKDTNGKVKVISNPFAVPFYEKIEICPKQEIKDLIGALVNFTECILIAIDMQKKVNPFYSFLQTCNELYDKTISKLVSEIVEFESALLENLSISPEQVRQNAKIEIEIFKEKSHQHADDFLNAHTESKLVFDGMEEIDKLITVCRKVNKVHEETTIDAMRTKYYDTPLELVHRAKNDWAMTSKMNQAKEVIYLSFINKFKESHHQLQKMFDGIIDDIQYENNELVNNDALTAPPSASSSWSSLNESFLLNQFA